MDSLLALSDIAAARGDGLHPLLRALIERRAGVIELDRARDGCFTIAGPGPRTELPATLPENVVRFDAGAAAAQRAVRRSSAG